MAKNLTRFITLSEEQKAGINMKLQEVQAELNIPRYEDQNLAMRVLLGAQRLVEFLSFQETEALDFSPLFSDSIQHAFVLAQAISSNLAGIVPLHEAVLSTESAERFISATSSMFADLTNNPNRSHQEILKTLINPLGAVYVETVTARFTFTALADVSTLPTQSAVVDRMFSRLKLLVKVSQARVDANSYSNDNVPSSLGGAYGRSLADAYIKLITTARIVLVAASSPVLRLELAREPEVAMAEFVSNLDQALASKLFSLKDVTSLTEQVSGMEEVVKDRLSKIQTVMSETIDSATEQRLDAEETTFRMKAESVKSTVTDTVKKYSPSARTWKWIGVGAAAVGVGTAGAYFYRKYGRKVRAVSAEELENNPTLEIVVTAPVAE